MDTRKMHRYLSVSQLQGISVVMNLKILQADGFQQIHKKKPRIRILDERIINLRLQTCGLVSLQQTVAKWGKSIAVTDNNKHTNFVITDKFIFTLENYL